MQIGLINTRSIKSDRKGNSLEDYVNDTAYHIYAITETWLPADADKGDQSWGPSIHGYSNIASRGRKRKTGGGVTWFIRNDLIKDVEEIDTGFPYRDEMQVSHIRLSGLDLVCAYIIPDMPEDFHLNVLRYIKKLDSRKSIIMGDFNLPLVNFNAATAKGAKAKLILDFYIENINLDQLINEPTHEDGNTLDLVFVSDPEIASESDTEVHKNEAKLHSWDHYPITITINTKITVHDAKIYQRSMKDADWDKYNRFLLECDWSGNNADELQVTIRKNIQTAADVAIPYKLRTIKQVTEDKYISKETRELFALTKRLRRLYKDCPSTNNYNLYLAVNAYKRKLVKRDNDEFANQNIYQDSGAFWRHVNRRKRTDRGIPTLIEKEQKITEDKPKADLLRKQFLSVFEPEKPFNGNPTPDPNLPQMPDISFTEDLIRKAITSLKPNSAPGEDGIPSLFLKKGIAVLAEPLKRLYQASYDEGRWPKEWRHAIIIPLHKKGKRSDYTNYRPISLMPSMAKGMEKAIKIELTKWYKEQNRWEKFQHAFMAKRSTNTCLLEQSTKVDNWLKEKDVGYVGYVAIDKAKAFDKVSFEELGRTMINEGMPPKLTTWQLHGLQNRNFKVKVGDSMSEIGKPTSGILQGSCLSPYLWIQHMQSLGRRIQNLTKQSDKTKIFIYADDVCFIFKITKNNQHADETFFQNILHEYDKEAKKKSLFIHPDKSQLMKIYRGNFRSDTNFHISGKQIPEVKEMKILGVTYDSEYGPNAHFATVVKRVKQRVFQLRKVVTSSNLSVRTLVWNLVMGSLIRYGWAGTKKYSPTQINQLQALQHIWMKPARICPQSCPHRPGSPNNLWENQERRLQTNRTGNPSVNACQKHSGPVPILQSLIYEDFMTLHDVLTGKMDADISIPLTTEGRERTLRSTTSGGQLIPQKHEKASHEKAFMARVTEYVNALPEKYRHEFIKLASSSHNSNRQHIHVAGSQSKTTNETEKNTLTSSSHNSNHQHTHVAGSQNKTTKETEENTRFSAAAKPLSRTALRSGIKLNGLFSLNPVVDAKRHWKPKEISAHTSFIENKINLRGLLNGIKINTPKRLKDEALQDKERKRRETSPRLLFQ